MKRTYQPSKLVRKRRHGFRSRMETVGGRKVLSSRRAKGRKRLSVEPTGQPRVAKDEIAPGSPVGRLKRRADFLRVAGARRKWAAPGLILQACPQLESDRKPESDRPFPVRVGFTASRKVGNAVMRNRARRRLKAVVAELLGRHAKPGHDLVLIARTATCDCPFEDLKRDLLQGLKRTKAAA